MKLKRITPEEIAEYGVVNAPDKLVGNPHDNKMIFDRLIREVVAGAINALIDQWGEMDEAEDKRDEAEEQREAAEQARQAAENLRQNTFREEIEEAKRHEEGAYRAMDQAAENAHWSEAFAVGRENGVDIDSTNPAYRNNAKFYAEQARSVVGGDDVFVCPNILVSAADWSASTKYDDFPWEATAQVKDINGQHVPFVVFDHVDAATYGLATVADTADESLTIYSVTMPERDILIPVTVFMSEGAIQSAWKALSGGKEGEVLAKQSGKDHDFKWMPISGLGAGLDGERGLAIYRANKPWSEWTSEYFGFDDFILPADYEPKPNDLVLTSNNYLCWIYSVNENAKEAVVASFMPAVSLNGGPGPAGDPGVSPNISILPGERDEEDGTVRYGTVIEVTNPDGSKVYAFVPDGRDGDPGPAGASGKDGSAGKDGVTFTPSVSSAGVLSWTNDGGKQNPTSVNIKGPAGPAGKDGSAGKDGERGLAIYRCSQAMYGMTSDTIDFAKFQLPVGYVPKVNDLVITADNYLYYVYQVNATTDEITLASFYPPVNLNGVEGPAGPAGKNGSAGKDGVTFTPSVSSAGVLSWTNDGGKQNPTSVNIKGPAGPAGEPGDTPYIGANGNWWIGGTDTGVAATGSGSGGASVQADWGENDETKLSHVKRRTHWKEEFPGKDIILETTKTFGGNTVLSGAKGSLTDGEEYIVTWNGKEYACVCHGKYVGNKSLASGGGDDTGEPFYISNTSGTLYQIIKANSASESIAFGVKTPTKVTWHKMDPGYLPDGVPYTEESVVELLNVTAEVDPDSGVAFLSMTAIGVAAGDTLIVNYNGMEYECEVLDGKAMDPNADLGSWVAGNIGTLTGTGSSGEPFVLIGSSAYSMLMPLDGSSTVSVSLNKISKVVHPLAPKYLPDYLPRIENVGGIILPETTVTEVSSDGTKFDVTGNLVRWEVGIYYDVTLNGETNRYIVNEELAGSGNLQLREYIADKDGNLAVGPFVARYYEINGSKSFFFGGLAVGDTIKIEGPIIYHKMSRNFIPTASEPLLIHLGYAPSGNVHTINVTETELGQAIYDGRPIVLYFNYDNTASRRAYNFAESDYSYHFTSVRIRSNSSVTCYGISIESFNSDGTVTVTEYKKLI